MAMLWLPGILLPKPPPVYSLMSTTSSTLMPTMRAMLGTVCAVLCVEPWRNSFPFCQYAMALRVSSGWWPVDWE
jgi:hypothetical protein